MQAGDNEDQKAKKAGDGKNQKAGKASDGRDQEARKVGYDRVDDGVGVSRFPEDVKVGNNSMSDSARNQDN